MVGLDASGKTTVLFKLKDGTAAATVPTIGFNVEEVAIHNVTFTVWDVGGQERIRSLWRHYYSSADAVIFVVDSSDEERMPDARQEIERLVTAHELSGAALLVFANKQDLPTSLSPSEVATRVGVDSLIGRKWYV